MISITFVMDVVRYMLNSRREFIWVCNNFSVVSSIQQGPPICKNVSHMRQLGNWVGCGTAQTTKYQLLCKLVEVKHASISTAWSVTINHQVLIPSLLQTRVYHDVSSCFDDFFTDCGSTSAGVATARSNQALVYLCITHWSRRSSSKCCNPCGA